MKILVYLAHPAHFYLFKNSIAELRKKNHTVIIASKNKDVLQQLLIEHKEDYVKIEKKQRADNKIAIVWNSIFRSLRLGAIIKKNKIDLVVSSAADFAPICRMYGAPIINFLEDDLAEFPMYSRIFGPFINQIICPVSCDTGRLEEKTIHYPGNQELAYLHPNSFIPSWDIVKALFSKDKKNYIFRFAKLTAWHDDNISGISNKTAEKIINYLGALGNVFISSERELPESIDKFRIKISAKEMHHFLFYADLLISDSQTMTAEAAVLGTPSVRYNDWVGRLGYLEELETKYGLTFGVKSGEEEILLKIIKEVISKSEDKTYWQQNRKKFINNSIQTDKMITWFIENYPNSVSTCSGNKSYIFNNFR
ncbi:MAG: DUF354 domain-containing protein [Melioribacteraceae bacterium]|jgi:predicted glycosyltransferase|nr:DUF354 domain-containing protein [Melioribacteraceae bacterium]